MLSAQAPLLLLAGSAATAAAQCTKERFETMIAGNEAASVRDVTPVAAGGTFGPPTKAFPAPAKNLSALCSVTVNVKSSASSSYNFGLFLPDSGWNERFLTTGNGGFGGGINWVDMNIFAHHGFATMSTDTGHNATAFDATWGLNQPEKLIDWGSRAMHGSIELAKTMVASYYGGSSSNSTAAEAVATIKYSYYASCSTGGRQGLKEIQHHPESFDGIVVGAPAWWTTHLAAFTLQAPLYNFPENASHHVGQPLIKTITSEILKQCDGQDGLEDGIISDTFGCNFNYDKLLCADEAGNAGASASAANQTDCLTPEQVQTVYKVYNEWREDNGSTLVFPGLPLGADPSGMLLSFSGLGRGLWENWVYNDSNWDYTKFTYADVLEADRVDPGDAAADDFDMAAYRARGGKIIMYHGMADLGIPTGSSRVFYDNVHQAMGGGGGADGAEKEEEKEEVDLTDFYRFFLIPGMGHCNSGPGPWYIAGGSQDLPNITHSVPGHEDAEHDVVLAMMRWVEEDQAPEQLIGTKFVGDDGAKGIESQRPICMYPKRARYIGTSKEDVNKPESWECPKE
ncbi:ferulic acid Esterase/Feruloyl esterase [Apiospora hydei]|uniref:Carboxylic ester hydrolase n=1 Tax=Apiospora hydei TaxID=1337664 RepID=A0ABR1UVM2_9PEZI